MYPKFSHAISKGNNVFVIFGGLFDVFKQLEDSRHVFCCYDVEDTLVLVGYINLVNEACFAGTFYFMSMRG